MSLTEYYDTSYPPSVWGGGTVPATTGVAGIPGSWLPAGSRPPASVAALQGGTPVTVTASPGTGWTTGQYVQTRTSGAAGRATWTGTGWVGGAAPLTADDVSAMTVDDVKDFIREHPDLLAEVTELERNGKHRTTLLEWLQELLDEEDEEEDS